jgi:type III secretion system FlhB-like substrate exporter
MSEYYELHEEAVYAARANVRIARKVLDKAKMAYVKAEEDRVLVKQSLEDHDVLLAPPLGFWEYPDKITIAIRRPTK